MSYQFVTKRCQCANVWKRRRGRLSGRALVLGHPSWGHRSRGRLSGHRYAMRHVFRICRSSFVY